ncbi:hypothetical protein CABS01_08546 [Colletotrichum abscissum]|uniref:uncharacterized protein n=1 Tax=Colletotrichum abscissum TaxID=1671311 RepID=UPI0027D5DE19|nr:uncharacterized protein CABS01_08546 [Colletotrichum abscissum]KAK1507366.1 hypothetical protein CABS01_08546 [Colletotrichum abscissum]
MGAPVARLVGVCGYWCVRDHVRYGDRGEEEMKGYLHLYLWAKGWNSVLRSCGVINLSPTGFLPDVEELRNQKMEVSAQRLRQDAEILKGEVDQHTIPCSRRRGLGWYGPSTPAGSAYYVEVRVLEMYRSIFYRLFSLTDVETLLMNQQASISSPRPNSERFVRERNTTHGQPNNPRAGKGFSSGMALRDWPELIPTPGRVCASSRITPGGPTKLLSAVRSSRPIAPRRSCWGS